MPQPVILPIENVPDNTPPEWVHLLPAGRFAACGGSKVLYNNQPEKLIAASQEAARGKLVLDENHSTDRAMASLNNGQARAVGWIVEMQPRENGIWGRVEWTAHGASLMADKLYRAISPVILSDKKTGDVLLIERAALTNTPDLATLTTLHSASYMAENHIKETNMDGLKWSELRIKLGLPPDADQSMIEGALARARSVKTMHAQVASLVGLGSDADDARIINTLTARKEELTLHSQRVASLTSELNSLKEERKKAEAAHFITESGRKKIISQEMAETLRSLHSTDPAMAESIVAGLPDAPVNAQRSLHGAPTPEAPKAEGIEVWGRAFGLNNDEMKQEGLI